jgi:hypothetical protein
MVVPFLAGRIAAVAENTGSDEVYHPYTPAAAELVAAGPDVPA